MAASHEKGVAAATLDVEFDFNSFRRRNPSISSTFCVPLPRLFHIYLAKSPMIDYVTVILDIFTR